jgi:hypothetical protein
MKRQPTIRRSHGPAAKVMETLAYAGAGGFALLLWYIGARFTVAAIPVVCGWLQLPEPPLPVQWCIPVVLSAIEVRWMHHYGRLFIRPTPQGVIFTIAAYPDVLTTCLGVNTSAMPQLAGRPRWVMVPAVLVIQVAAIALTFVPEWLIGWAVRGIRAIWWPPKPVPVVRQARGAV